MERKTIIATHGHLASGFKSALNIIVGEIPNLIVMDCYTEDGFNMDEELEKLFSSIDFQNEEVYVFTDLMGGSVNNAFFKMLANYNFHLVTNTSLGMLIDYFLTMPDADTIKQKIQSSEFITVYCNDFLHKTNTDEQDDI